MFLLMTWLIWLWKVCVGNICRCLGKINGWVTYCVTRIRHSGHILGLRGHGALELSNNTRKVLQCPEHAPTSSFSLLRAPMPPTTAFTSYRNRGSIDPLWQGWQGCRHLFFLAHLIGFLSIFSCFLPLCHRILPTVSPVFEIFKTPGMAIAIPAILVSPPLHRLFLDIK